MAAYEELKVTLHRRTGLATWRVTGADRAAYLHRMLTQDIESIATGEADYACFLTVKGRILGDMLVWNAGDHLLLELEEAAVPAVIPALERYVITDDVAFEDVTAHGVRYVLAASESSEALQRAGFERPEQGAFLEIECGGAPARLLRFDRRGLISYEIAVAPDAADALEQRLGLTADAEGYYACCVFHGVPRFGPELGEDVLFNEADLEEAVSWTKGCFPGQEPVVMARDRGRPPRRLVRLFLEPDAVPAVGAAVLTNNHQVGRITSAAPSTGGPSAALAYVKHPFAREGRTFEVEGSGTATATLPLPGVL